MPRAPTLPHRLRIPFAVWQVPSPIAHPSFAPIFQDVWVKDLRTKLAQVSVCVLSVLMMWCARVCGLLCSLRGVKRYLGLRMKI